MSDSSAEGSPSGTGPGRAASNPLMLDGIPTDEINAEAVEIRNSSVQNASAAELSVHQSAVNHMNGGTIQVSQSAAAALNGDRVQVDQSLVGVARSQDLAAEGFVGLGIAESMRVEDSGAGILLANDIRGQELRSVVLLANQVEGEVVTMLDTPRAALAGMVTGIAIGLVLLVGRLLIRGR